MLLPLNTQAELAVVFSDVSGGVFRFQVKLAEQGNPEAQYKVGEMYELGKGVSKNNITAKTWFEKAAKQGHKKSTYKLLYLEIKANGLNDYTKTQLGMLRQESASGSPDAQYFLGKLYATGIGVPKNLENALTWLNKASFNGVTEAEHEAIAVEEELARIRLKEAAKRTAAIAAAKKRKALEEEQAREKARADQAKAEKQRAAKNKAKAEAAKRKSDKNSENRKAAAERMRQEEERKAIAEEKAQQERERQAAAEKERKAESARKSTTASSKEKSSFESDPCKGKSARFLSTCR